MLSFFRINDPYRLIFIFLILVGVRLAWMLTGLAFSVPELHWLLIGQRLSDGFVMYREVYDHTGPLAAMVYKWLDVLFGQSRWAHWVISTFLVIVQAGILNNVLLKNKAYDENNYLPAFFYVMLTCGLSDFFALSPQLLSLTFVLLSLSHIFRRIDNVVTDELFLSSGIYLGIATFFYLPAAVFFLAFLLSFVLFSSAVLRRLLLFVYGAGLVFLLIWCYYFWFEAHRDFAFSFFYAGLFTSGSYGLTLGQTLLAAAAILLVSLLGFSTLFSQRFTNFQQKMQQVMVLFFVGGGLIIWLTRERITADLLFLLPTAAYFLVYYVLGLRRRFIRFLLPWIIVLGVLLYPIFWMRQPASESLLVAPSKLPFTHEKLMGIGLSPEHYIGQQLAGPFLDKRISQERLKGLDYYGQAAELYEVIERSSPSVIIDSLGVMPKMLDRFPRLAEAYEQKNEGYYVRRN